MPDPVFVKKELDRILGKPKPTLNDFIDRLDKIIVLLEDLNKKGNTVTIKSDDKQLSIHSLSSTRSGLSQN